MFPHGVFDIVASYYSYSSRMSRNEDTIKTVPVPPLINYVYSW